MSNCGIANILYDASLQHAEDIDRELIPEFVQSIEHDLIQFNPYFQDLVYLVIYFLNILHIKFW